jgi:hypothetical protein
MFGGEIESVIEIVEVVVVRLQVMCLTSDNVETYILQVIHKGGGVSHIPQHGETVTAGAHIEDTKYSAAIGEMHHSFSEMHIIFSVSRIENELRGRLSQEFIQPSGLKAHLLIGLVNNGPCRLKYIEIVLSEYSDPHTL